jgi:hypothetical protein
MIKKKTAYFSKITILTLIVTLSYVSISAKERKHKFTKDDIAQIYNAAFNEIVNKSQNVVRINSDFTEYKMFLSLMFRKKEYKIISRYFEISPTESWRPKKEYFDFLGKIILVSEDERDKLTSKAIKSFENQLHSLAYLEHGKEKEVIKFSKIAFNNNFDEAYMFVSYYNNPLDSETSFCYLQKTNDKWEVKLLFTVTIG